MAKRAESIHRECFGAWGVLSRCRNYGPTALCIVLSRPGIPLSITRGRGFAIRGHCSHVGPRALGTTIAVTRHQSACACKRDARSVLVGAEAPCGPDISLLPPIGRRCDILRQIMTGSGVMTGGGLCLDQGGRGVPSASSQPAILSVDFDTCVYYLYVMKHHSRPIPVTQNMPNDIRLWLNAMPEEHKVALTLVGIMFDGWGTGVSAFMYRRGSTTWCFKPSWPPDRPARVMLDAVASGTLQDHTTYWPRLEASTAKVAVVNSAGCNNSAP